MYACLSHKNSTKQHTYNVAIHFYKVVSCWAGHHLCALILPIFQYLYFLMYTLSTYVIVSFYNTICTLNVLTALSWLPFILLAWFQLITLNNS